METEIDSARRKDESNPFRSHLDFWHPGMVRMIEANEA